MITMNYIYVVYVFDKFTEKLVSDYELSNCNTNYVKKLFEPGDESSDCLVGVYPVSKMEQIEYLRECNPNLEFDLDNYIYTIEANTI